MNKFFICFLILCTILCIIYIPPVQCYAQQKDGTYYFYTAQNFNSAITTTIKNGDGYIISCDIKNSFLVRKELNSNFLLGESFVFEGDDNDVVLILTDLDILYKYYNNLDIVAYSPKIPYTMHINNQIFNVQISKNNNNIYVGFPAILGSF